MPRSPRCLFHPQDHGALEDIALHPHLGELALQPAHVGGVGAGTLGNWVHKDRMSRGDGPDRTRVDPAYVRRLERELAEVRMERDVLKRSVVLWVKEATR